MSPRRQEGRPRLPGPMPSPAGLILCILGLVSGPQLRDLVAQEPSTGTEPAVVTELTGHVVRGIGGQGVPGTMVELHRVTTEGGAVIDSAVAATDGAFRFQLPEDEGRPIFLAAARHQGVRYFGPAQHAGGTLDEPYEISVYDTTAVATAPTDLRIASRHVVVTRGEDGLEVAEVVDIVNPGDRTLVPATDSLALWSAGLPPRARSPRALEGGVPGGAVEFRAGRVLLRSMISPMGVRVSYSYAVDGSELDLEIELPTDRLQLVVAGAEADVEGATHAETSTRTGRLVHRYDASRLEVGDAVQVRIISPGGVDGWVIGWALIGIVLLAAAVVVARLPAK